MTIEQEVALSIPNLTSIKGSMFYLLGRELPGEAIFTLREPAETTIEVEGGLKARAMSLEDPLSLIVAPLGLDELKVICFRHAASYGQSTYSDKSEFSERYPIVPAGENDILFSGTLEINDENDSMEFVQNDCGFKSPERALQMHHAQRVLPELPVMILNARVSMIG